MAATREGHGSVLHWNNKHIYLHSKCLALGHMGSLWQNRKLLHSPVRAEITVSPKSQDLAFTGPASISASQGAGGSPQV